MRARRLFLASAVLLIVGLASLWSKWNGSAGIHAGWPIQQWDVSFSGSVNGWPAMIGILCLLIGLVTFLIALIRTVLE
jgi:hypothetical protein